jgi:hypothetical protein
MIQTVCTRGRSRRAAAESPSLAALYRQTFEWTEKSPCNDCGGAK